MLLVGLLCLFMGTVFFFGLLRGLRESFLASCLAHGIYTLAVSEILGALELFSPEYITWSWILPVVIWGILLSLISPERVIRNMIQRIRQRVFEIRGFDLWLAVMMLILALISLTVAVFGLPNNWDSLTYHLPRIVFWLQNRSLDCFPTDDYRLLYNPPFTELAQAHVKILSGGFESAMNLVQWAAYVQLILAVTIIAEALGARQKEQLVTALVVSTMPPLLLQASTTQNDLLMTALLCTALAFWLKSVAHFSALRWGLGILAAGLALATKATTFIFLPFIVLVPVIYELRNRRVFAVLALILVLIPSVGWMSRNQSSFGSPFGYHDDGLMQEKTNYYRNGYFSLTQGIGCTAKSISLFFATPSSRVNSAIERTVRWVHDLMGENPDDERLRWYDMVYHVPTVGPHEDNPPMLWHFLAALFLWIVIIRATFQKRRITIQGQLALLFLLGLVVTCVYVKWMPWNTRFLVAWLVLLFAVAGKIINVWPIRIKKAVCVFLFLLALPFALFSMKRSVVSFSPNISGTPLHFVGVFKKDDALRYSAANPDRALDLAELVKAVSEIHPKHIGIMRKGIDPVIYPFMALIRKELPHASFHYAQLNNQSVSLKKSAAPLNVVVTVGSPGTLPDNSAYSLGFTNTYGSIWIPRPEK